MKCFFSLVYIVSYYTMDSVSNNSITKQLLTNQATLQLNSDLSEIIKGYIFYDQVGQEIKKRRDRLLYVLKNHITIGKSFGFTELSAPLNVVHTQVRRWAYIRIWKYGINFPSPIMQYIMCSVCGNFYQTRRQLPLTRDEIEALSTNISHTECSCLFKFNMQQQYASIQLNSNFTKDSEFDDDFNEASSENEAVGHIQLSDDSDNSEQQDEEQEVEYFYNHM